MLKFIFTLLVFGEVGIDDNVKVEGGGHPLPETEAITVNLSYEF